MIIDRAELQRVMQSKIGAPYLLGAKWDLKDKDPKGPIDCSGYVRWGWAQIGILIPDGSFSQIVQCRKVQGNVMPGDLGFFKTQAGATHHVGMVFDEFKVIEARGEMHSMGNPADIGEHVMFRPRAAWEAWKEFTGWMRPFAVLNVESAV